MKNSNMLAEEGAIAARDYDQQVAGIGSVARIFARNVAKINKQSTQKAYQAGNTRVGPSAIERADMAESLIPGAVVIHPPVTGPAEPAAVASPGPGGGAEVPAGAPGGEAPVEAVGGVPRETTSPLQSPEMTTDDALDIATDAYGAGGTPEFRTAERNINLNYVDPVDTNEMGYLLDATAKKYEMGEAPRTFEDVEVAASDANQVLSKILTGEQIGLMTDVQKFAARQIMVDLADRAVAIADEIAQGNKNRIKLLEYRKVMNAVVAWQTFLQKDIKETARALNQQKMVATAIDSKSLTAINDALMAGGSAESIAKQASNHVKAVEKAGKEADSAAEASLEGAAKTVKKWSYWGIATEFWKNNLLSGPSTHMINTASNAAMNGYENLLIKPAAAMVGAVRSRVTGNMDRISKEEVIASAATSYAGIRDGVIAFAETLTSEAGESTLIGGSKTGADSFSNIRQLAEGKGRLAKLGADAATISFRLLQAEDDFFKVLAYRQSLVGLAARDGVRRGLEGDDLGDHIVKILDDPPTVMHDEAAQKARELTFTDQPTEGIFALMQQLGRTSVNAYPAISFVMPFITTPTNVVRYAMNNSPIALLSPTVYADIAAGGARADMAIARVMVGITFSTLIYVLHEQGLVTGGGPDDIGQRKMLEATGWKPLAYKFGDEYVSMRRADPFSTMMAMVATNMDVNKYSKDSYASETHFIQAGFILGEHVLNGTYMQGMANMLEAIEKKDGRYFLASLASGFVPYSGMVATVERAVDPEIRRRSMDPISAPGYDSYIESIKQRIMSRVPGLSEDLRPARYWDGAPIMPNMGVLGRMILPVQIGIGKRDEATLALFQNGISIGDPSPIISYGPLKVSLNKLDNNGGRFYDAYIVQVGRARRDGVQDAMLSPEYIAAEIGPGGMRDIILRSALAGARMVGFGKWLTEDAFRLANEIPYEELSDQGQLFLGGPEIALDFALESGVAGDTIEGTRFRGNTDAGDIEAPPHF